MIKIAIVGASYLQLPLIIKAKERGIETHVFAWKMNDDGEKEADCFYPISIIEKEKILNECKKIGISGICSIASDLAMVTVNYVANELGLIGNSMSCVRVSTNKYYMRERFLREGDPSVRFCLVDDMNISEKINKMQFPLIVKPVDRSGSRGVTKVETMHEILPAVAFAQSQGFNNQVIIEEYVDGTEYSIESISWKGKHTVLAITQKWTTGAPHYIEVAHMEPAFLDEDTINQLRKVVCHALDSLEIEYGASHTEVKINNNEISIIEIGGRMGGDFIGSELVQLSTGFDFVNAVIDVALGKEPAINADQLGAAAIKYIFNEYDMGIINRIEKEHPEYIVHKSMQKLDGRVISDSSSRYGYVLLHAKNRENLMEYI